MQHLVLVRTFVTRNTTKRCQRIWESFNLSRPGVPFTKMDERYSQHGLVITSIEHKMWDEITCPFPNVNGFAIRLPDMWLLIYVGITLPWHHNGRGGVSNHQPHDCLLNRLFRHSSKKTSTFRVTGLCEGNSPVTGEFPTQRASNVENVSIGDVII